MSCAKRWLAISIASVVVCLIGLSGCGDEGVVRPEIALQATPSEGIQSYRGGVALWVVEVELTPAVARPVTVDATSAAGVDCQVVPSELSGSGLVEVVARPGPTAVRETTEVVVRARLDDDAGAAASDGSAQLALPLEVLRYRDMLADEANQRLTPFTSYLAAEHPEFGIDDTTAWEGFVSAPNILVVTWYSFLSSDWEALIQWHVMIPPYDWTHVYLRRRGALSCEWAGETSTAGAPVTEVAPPDPFPRFEAPWISLSEGG
jgi:hypothetical protein